MKAISLHAPWGSLIALGIKRFETRSWACPPGIVGTRVAIHQAKRKPDEGAIGDYYVEPYFENVHHVDECDCEFEGGVAPSCIKGSTHRMVLTRPGPILMADLPLGCIVASGVITRSLPILSNSHRMDVTGQYMLNERGLFAQCLGVFNEDGRGEGGDYTDDLPYGDFTPGRWAWELSDVAATTERCPACWGERAFGADLRQEAGTWCPVCHGTGKCEPIPAKGRQQFWNWEPT